MSTYFDLNPSHGTNSFDNVPLAFIAFIQCITFDDWATPMYALMAASSPHAWVYFVLFVVLVAFFVVSVVSFGATAFPSPALALEVLQRGVMKHSDLLRCLALRGPLACEPQHRLVPITEGDALALAACGPRRSAARRRTPRRGLDHLRWRRSRSGAMRLARCRWSRGEPAWVWPLAWHGGACAA